MKPSRLGIPATSTQRGQLARAAQAHRAAAVRYEMAAETFAREWHRLAETAEGLHELLLAAGHPTGYPPADVATLGRWELAGHFVSWAVPPGEPRKRIVGIAREIEDRTRLIVRQPRQAASE